jgi:hypothetical protein
MHWRLVERTTVLLAVDSTKFIQNAVLSNCSELPQERLGRRELFALNTFKALPQNSWVDFDA